jgi:sulfhydrogenase subunit beta (sulfur reductase)
MECTKQSPVVLEAQDFDLLFAALHKRGYCTVGPRLIDDEIHYDRIQKASELPIGIVDCQDAGTYRLEHSNNGMFFAYTVPAQSFKKFLFPPETMIFQTNRRGKSFEVEECSEKSPKYAFIGIRGCELSAIKIQDQVFLGGPYTDPHYRANREELFIVALNCARAVNTCFCASMDSGPEVKDHFDLLLTEIQEHDRHVFIVESQGDRAEELLMDLPLKRASQQDLFLKDHIIAQTTQQLTKRMETQGLKELLDQSLESSRWDKIAQRCLSCANCTMVCPTCFCSTVEDNSDLTGDHAQRWRTWDSCFSLDHSYIHGGEVRRSLPSRYRQWLTHKLSTWIDQFGTSGCVGCGRCITWCPVGIDITEEVQSLRLENESILEVKEHDSNN